LIHHEILVLSPGNLDRPEKRLSELTHRKTLHDGSSCLPAHFRSQNSILQKYAGVFAQLIGVVAQKAAHTVLNR
jgi:hypothetical protein